MRLCNALSFVAVVAYALSCKEDNTTTSPPRQTPFPSFGAEESVTIPGYSSDAMEPFISHDGTFLFFNSLNNGTNTTLYYARRTDDASFDFVGVIGGVNQTQPPYLDAFEQPSVIHSDLPAIPEAATLTMDKKIMYYHKKVGGVFKIFMRRRVR